MWLSYTHFQPTFEQVAIAFSRISRGFWRIWLVKTVLSVPAGSPVVISLTPALFSFDLFR